MASKAWYKPSAIPQLIARFDPPPAALPDYASKKTIEVWTTTCIVTNFGMMRDVIHRPTPHDESSQHSPLPLCSTLINPANPYLTGPNTFPYFPRGGPQPLSQPIRPAHHIMGYVSQWGGMDVGSGMLFPAEAIDGLVHQLGGLRLRAECSLVPTHDYAHAYRNQQSEPKDANDIENGDTKAKCPVGTAVSTFPGGDELQKHYDTITHTTPPFYNYPPSVTRELKEILGIEEGSDLHSVSRELLRSCYRQSFKLAFAKKSPIESGQNSLIPNPLRLFGFGEPPTEQLAIRLAVPLLGAGCRAFPKDVALEVAALESAAWLSNKVDGEQDMKEEEKSSNTVRRDTTVVFGLLETADAEELSTQLENLLSDLP